MDPITHERLLGLAQALDHPLVRGVCLTLVVAALLTPLLLRLTSGQLSEPLRKDLWARYFSWLIFIPMMLGPILLGAACTIAAVCLLSLLCYREFALATGAAREWITSAMVVLGIALITFATADNWYGFFVAITPLMIFAIATTAILPDRPQGYTQRVALGLFAFLLFGVCYGHLGYFANDTNYRAILVWLLVCVEMNDIFAYTTGKTFGRRKLAPNTSPNKTVAGALGALVLTTALAAALGHFVFEETPLNRLPHLIALGILISVSGQLGDLTLSSIKRDLGIKDWTSTFPGHGGLLDRFNSLIFAGPLVFHYVNYFYGMALDQPQRIITGG